MSSRPIYDWPLRPAAERVHAGGRSVADAMTVTGTVLNSTEPGGRLWLEADYGMIRDNRAGSLVSWLLSSVAPGAIFRIRKERGPQVASYAALGLSPTVSQLETGIPWDNDQPFENGFGWFYEPIATADAAALEGTVTLVIDMGSLLPGLSFGHAIGHADVMYVVMAISYAGSLATVTVSPPLRKNVAEGDVISLHPAGLFTMTNPENFRSGLYSAGSMIRLGQVRFREARP